MYVSIYLSIYISIYAANYVSMYVILPKTKIKLVQVYFCKLFLLFSLVTKSINLDFLLLSRNQKVMFKLLFTFAVEGDFIPLLGISTKLMESLYVTNCALIYFDKQYNDNFLTTRWLSI